MKTIIHNEIINDAVQHPKLARGQVWCTQCGATLKVDSSECMRNGWPRCCGYTMTIDAPNERITPSKPGDQTETTGVTQTSL